MTLSLHPSLSRAWIAVDHPAWRQAHASTVVRAGEHLVAAWFAGTREGSPDNTIWMSRRVGGQWSAPWVVASGQTAHWNPVLTHSPSGQLWLFYKVGDRISRWRTMVTVSDDHGTTWSSPRLLVDGDVNGRGPVKNPPLLHHGTWLAGGSTELWAPEPQWECFIDLSEDAGITWRKIPLDIDRQNLQGAGVIQPALWSRGESVFALVRSTEGWAFRSESRDNGLSWTQLEPTSLVNNNSGLAVAALPNGTVVCVHNPISGDWAHRCPLSTSISADDGRTWSPGPMIEDGRTPLGGLSPSAPTEGGFQPADDGVMTTGEGEYSYPCALVDCDELIVTYTWQRRGIVEARLPLQAFDRSTAGNATEQHITELENRT